MALLILLMLLVHTQFTAAGMLKRVERRVRIMEEQVQHDSSEFRDKLDIVLEKLNGTESQPFEQFLYMAMGQDIQKNFIILQKDLAINYGQLKYGFSREKQYFRRSLNKVDTELGHLKQKIISTAQEFNTTVISFQRQENETNVQIVNRFDSLTHNVSIFKKRLTSEFVYLKGKYLSADQEFNKTVYSIQNHTNIANERILNKFDRMAENISILQTRTGKLEDAFREYDQLTEKIKLITTDLQATRDSLDRVSNELAIIRADPLQHLSILLGMSIYQFKNSYYVFGNEKLNFADASHACQKLGGYLSEVTSKEENDFVINIAKGNFVLEESRDIWIGGMHDHEKDGWKWIHSNVPLSHTFTSWAPSEPRGHHQLCVQLWASQQYLWDNDSCDKTDYYICEINQVLGLIASCLKDFL